MFRGVVGFVLAIFLFASLRLILKILEKIIGCDVLKQNKNNNNNNNNLYNI